MKTSGKRRRISRIKIAGLALALMLALVTAFAPATAYAAQDPPAGPGIGRYVNGGEDADQDGNGGLEKKRHEDFGKNGKKDSAGFRKTEKKSIDGKPGRGSIDKNREWGLIKKSGPRRRRHILDVNCKGYMPVNQ